MPRTLLYLSTATTLLLSVGLWFSAPTLPAFPTNSAPATSPALEVTLAKHPDLSGTWVGKMYQNPGGIAPEFEFTMEIAHNGIFVQGTSFVRHGRIWAEMRFSGHQKANGSIVLIETEILRSQKPEELSWCVKEYELRGEYTEAGLVLTGPWWGNSDYGPCIPGSVRLTRRVKTA